MLQGEGKKQIGGDHIYQMTLYGSFLFDFGNQISPNSPGF